MRKRLVILSAGVLLGTMLSGCGLDKVGDLGNKNIRMNTVRYDSSGNLIRDKRFADDGMNERNRTNGSQRISNNLVGSHKNYRLEMSSQIADQITEIEEIKSSYVMLADYNAYVAISLVDHEPHGNAKAMSRTHIGLFGKAGAADGRRMSSLSTGEDNLTDQLKMQVSSIVKEMRPSVRQVYVSANPDFVGRMNAYMSDAKLGYSLQNYIMEFNGMAERIFPVVKQDKDGMRSSSVSTPRKSRLLE